MFGIEKEKLVEGLKNVRKRLCAYYGDRGCDCKFGATKDAKWGSETGSGCPEVSQAYKLIEAMTQDEFNEISHRGKTLITVMPDVKKDE